MSDLGERLAKVKSDFDALGAEMKRLGEQRGAIDRRMAELQADQLRLQGAFTALTDLQGAEGSGGAPVAVEGDAPSGETKH